MINNKKTRRENNKFYLINVKAKPPTSKMMEDGKFLH